MFLPETAQETDIIYQKDDNNLLLNCFVGQNRENAFKTNSFCLVVYY